MKDRLLSVENLTTQFKTKKKSFKAVDSLSFDVKKGEILGIVGESGSGKTITSLSVMGLLPPNGYSTGTIFFDGENISNLPEKEMRKHRGKDISMIFQDPMMSIDQVFTVGSQIVEALLIHNKMTKNKAKTKAIELLKSVEIPDPKRVFDAYPFQLSGGMCQRVMIAIALSCNPKLLFADEPTTALDVTIQAQILDLLKNIQKSNGMGVVFITHDLGVVKDIADRIIVMYAGKTMECANTDVIFNKPLHPYTMGLIQSVPKASSKGKRLYSIDGMVPEISKMPKGCRFCTRCPLAIDICKSLEPDYVEVKQGHFVRCHRTTELEEGRIKIG